MLLKNSSITRKIFLGYFAMIFLMVIVSVYAVSSLRELNQITHTILQKDFQVISLTTRLLDTLLAQERNEKKFFIFNDPAIKQLFWERGEEFRDMLSQLKAIYSPRQEELLSKITLLHKNYENFFSNEINLLKKNGHLKAPDLSHKPKDKIKMLAYSIIALKKGAENSIDTKTKLSSLKGERAIKITLILCALSFFIGIPFALLIAFRISSL